MATSLAKAELEEGIPENPFLTQRSPWSLQLAGPCGLDARNTDAWAERHGPGRMRRSAGFRDQMALAESLAQLCELEQ